MYGLRVTAIPTALPLARKDYDDAVYRTVCVCVCLPCASPCFASTTTALKHPPPSTARRESACRRQWCVVVREPAPRDAFS